jgi:ligand-binding sensor domain-containing protein
MNRNIWFSVVFLFALCPVFAQPPIFNEAIVTPSKEIYDLMQDKKGFIWIGDELGVRRYDGVVFISYTHPQQTSLSTTGLVEDKQGRIWCHNFNGQIFYIEHEQMHLLNAYKSEADFFHKPFNIKQAFQKLYAATIYSSQFTKFSDKPYLSRSVI